MVDINSFIERLGTTKASVAKQLGLDPKSNTLSLYSKGKSFPTYEMCRKLLLAGMTVQELFGDDVADKVAVCANKDSESFIVDGVDLRNPENLAKIFRFPGFVEQFLKAVSDMNGKK